MQALTVCLMKFARLAIMMKSLLCAGLYLGLIGLSACEQAETALVEEESSPAQAKASQDGAPPVKIEAGKPKPAPKIAEQYPSPPPFHHQPQAVPESAVVKPAHIPQKSTPFRVRRCMNMGNALEAPNEGDWGYRISARDLRTVAAAGFDTVRIPIRWDVHTAHRPPYAIDAPFMARVNTVVREAQAAGLGVIIDVHHYEKLMQNPARQEKRFLEIWEQIARNFSGAPNNIYFEVLNEPTPDLTNAQLSNLYAKVLPIIRKTNPTRKVILGGNSWNSIEALSKIRFPNDSNLVATFHDYGPHEFTHQGAEWSEPKMPLGRRWGGKEDITELRDTYRKAQNFKAKTGLPILVGEFGVINKVPNDQRYQWTKARRKAIEAGGLSWCAWDFSGAFNAYDTTSGRWLPGAKDAYFGR